MMTNREVIVIGVMLVAAIALVVTFDIPLV